MLVAVALKLNIVLRLRLNNESLSFDVSLLSEVGQHLFEKVAPPAQTSKRQCQLFWDGFPSFRGFSLNLRRIRLYGKRQNRACSLQRGGLPPVSWTRR